MQRAGTWKFINKANGQQSIQVLTDTNASSIKRAFDAAKAALSPTSDDLLFGYDASGREYRYTSVDSGKKRNR